MPVKDINLLTVILPIRVSEDRIDALQRLRSYPKLDASIPGEISFLVIDDGSTAEHAREIEEICREQGYTYVRCATEDQLFSIGRCRNVGAQNAKTPYIFFQDIDLMPSPGFYAALIREIVVQSLPSNSAAFLMVPYIFLTEEGTEHYLSLSEDIRGQQFLHYALLNDVRYIQKVSTGTSANLYNRHYYLARGGNDPDFEGWGYEDLEFNCRSIRLARRFPLPEEWTSQVGNFSNVYSYSGWKSVYRLFGDMCWNKGIVLYHAWHPVNPSSSYSAVENKNREIFIKKMVAFRDQGIEPEPLPDLTAGRSLIFKKNAFVSNRDVLPFYGDVLRRHDDDDNFSSEQGLLRFVEENSIERVIFHNPYSSDRMENIYGWVRKNRIPLIVAERGALPGSIYYDDTGFLDDGDTYAEEKWNRDLTDDERARTCDYFSEIRSGHSALEAQSPPVGVAALRDLLKIEGSEKIVFIALQRPGDAVTRKFTYENLSYSDYLQELSAFARVVPPGWKVVFKKHPLEDVDPDLPGAISAADANVHDLLELADVVVTFNSGVGVLAMIHGKHVFHFGRAFYHSNNVNTQIRSHMDLVSELGRGISIDMDKARRFVRYLREEVYSFGRLQTKPTKMPDGTRMTATMGVKFRCLRFPGKVAIRYPHSDAKPEISWESYLYDRYRAANRMPAPARPNVPKKLKKRRLIPAFYKWSQKVPGLRVLTAMAAPIYDDWLAPRK